MTEQAKITVIMPSLNVAPFIRECMDSVVNQTLRDIEILCVDAGSTDGTLEILREFERRDSRVRVILSDRKSYGYQMNLGLDAARGKYIGIVETDDWIEPDMFETLWLTAERQEAELVKTNYFWYYTKPEKKNIPFENLKACRYERVFEPLEERELFSSAPSIWSGIYKRSMLLEQNIRFHETPGASYQDTSFHFMVCTVVKRAYLLDRCFLHYRRDNENSSVNSPGKVFCISDEMHYFEAFLEAHPERKPRLINFYMALKFEKYRWNFDRLAPHLQAEFFALMRKEFLQHRSEGLLQESCFADYAWEKLNLCLDRPYLFFERCGKVYAARPGRELFPAAEHICDSKTPSPVDLSLVIPAYNAENFIRRSIQSAQSQTVGSIEILCVDDGSDDHTLSIMREYAAADPRIAVFHQTNLGVGAARNTGLMAARGRYVLFLDADDALRGDAAAFLVAEADRRSLDVLYFDGKTIFETEQLERDNPYYRDAYEYPLELSETISGKAYFCRAKEDRKFRTSCAMGFYRRAYLERAGLFFPEGIYHEDNLFTLRTMIGAERVWHTQEQFYLRTLHGGSIMTMRKTFRHVYGYLFNTMEMLRFAGGLPYDPRLIRNVEDEIRGQSWHAKDDYKRLEDQQDFRNKLTDTERLFFDRFILEKTDGEAERIRSSASYRIGRILTWPARKLRGLLRCWKEQGFRYTIAQYGRALLGRGTKKQEKRTAKALILASDAYKMSGAFLSMIALNRELNRVLQIPTKVILPYWGSGESLVSEAGISYDMIPSTDWIVPIGTKRDFRFRAKKFDEHTENLRAAARIAKIALTEDFSVIHSNSCYTYVGSLAARLAGIPHAWHLREFLEEDQGKEIYCKKRGYRMIAAADRIIVISRALKEKASAFAPEEKLRLIYNGIDPARFYAPAKQIFQREKPVFLFVSGSDSPRKGRKDLVEACRLLKNEGCDFELRFVGWCGAALQDMIEAAGLTDRTRLFGYVKDTETAYRDADILFMCSEFEAFGRTTVEALMGGCLVIGANTGGTAELVKDAETGLLYQYGNPEDLAGRIRYALANRELMQKISAAGRSFAAEKLTAARNAQEIAQLYRELTQEEKRRSAAARWLLLRKADCCILYCKFRKHTVGRVLRALSDRIAAAELRRSCAPENGGKVKVSVLVPVYNEKDYLRQCLDSIVNQSLKDIEIICINDGSTDGSDAIIREYAARDKRIVFIDKPNSGYGASVNRGLDAAAGEYVSIVETDDFIEPRMLEELYRIASERGKVDIVKSAYWLYYDTEDGTGRREEAPIRSACCPPRSVFDVFQYPEIIYHHPSIWSCLYKREFLERKKIRFVEARGAGWVDNPFLIETFCQAESIAWTPEAYYCYRQTNPHASSFLKDCSIPFLRTREMLAFLDRKGIADRAIRGSVYKRILWNAASVLENPFYSPEKDDELIREQLQRVDEAFLQDPRLREKERAAYAYFLKKDA